MPLIRLRRFADYAVAGRATTTQWKFRLKDFVSVVAAVL